MTLSNRITMVRLFLTPPFFFAWYYLIKLDYASEFGIILLWILFVVCEVTDVLDGFLARKMGKISDVGKLLDPFADVVVRLTGFFCFHEFSLMASWVFAVILWRELGIMFIRMLMLKQNKVMAANIAGKMKSILYFLSGLGGLLAITAIVWFEGSEGRTVLISTVYYLFEVAALASVISFITYLVSFLKNQKQILL